MADDFGDTRATAGTITGETITGSIEAPGDQDWFTLMVTAGTTYAFELASDGNDGITFAGGRSTFTYTAIETGPYQLVVRDNSASGTTGTYAVRASLAEYPPNFIGGTSGNDLLVATAKDDIIAGGAGIDTVTFSGLRADYQVVGPSRGPIAVTRGVSDHLYDVERIHFDDVGIAFDVNGGSAIRVAQSLKVFHGRTEPARDYIRTSLALLDEGMRFDEFMQLKLDAFLGADATNEEIVSFLYRNVAEREPPAQAIEFYTGILESGMWTPGELAVYAANHQLNIGLDLIGVVRGGLVYSLL